MRPCSATSMQPPPHRCTAAEDVARRCPRLSRRINDAHLDARLCTNVLRSITLQHVPDGFAAPVPPQRVLPSNLG